MNLFNRSIIKTLENFASDPTPKTILVQGPNGCGKTFVVSQFSKSAFKKVVEVNFKTDRKKALMPFRMQHDLGVFYRVLQLTYNVELIEGQSIIILNDIQEFPELRSFLKKLVLDNKYKYIQTGSLINLWDSSKDEQLGELETIIDMAPMDFPEFLMANGKNDLLEEMNAAYKEGRQMDDNAFLLTEDFYKNYLIVGGMPEAVEAFINGKSFKKIDSIKKRIINSIISDYARIDEKRGHKTQKSFENILPSLLSPGGSFKSSVVFRRRTAMDAAKTLMALKRSGATLISRRAKEFTLSMPHSAQKEKFKLYFSDVGLLSYLIREQCKDEDIYQSILYSEHSKYLNILIENAICVDLYRHHPELYFYTWFDKMNHLQSIDFLFFDKAQSVAKRKIIPVYVLPPFARKDDHYKEMVRRNKSKFVDPAILYKGKIKKEAGITYLPYFMSSLL